MSLSFAATAAALRDRLRRDRLPLLALAAVVVAALVLRARMAALNVWPTVDGVMYLDQAQQLIRHGRLPFSCFPPGWPFIAAVPLAFFPADDPMAMLRAAQIANVVLSGVLLALTYALLRPRLGAWLAVLGALLMAVLPQNTVLAKSDLSEVAFTCALLAGWLLYERRRPLAAGLTLGYAYLIRPEALLLTAGLAVHTAWRERRAPWRLVVGHLEFMVPYLIYIRVATGAWDISSKTVALSESLAAHPGAGYLKLIADNTALLAPMLPALVGLPLVILALWGMVRRRGAWLWLWAPFAPVPFIINPMVERFWLPYVPVLLLAAGLGARDILGMLSPWWSSVAARRGAAAMLLALALAGFAHASRDDMRWIRYNTEAYYGLRDAGLWLRDQVTPDTVVASYKPYPAYWAGCRFLKYPELNDAAEYAVWARNNGVDYMVVCVKIVYVHRPGLEALLASPLPDELAPRLTLVKLLTFDRAEQNTAIYRVERR